MTKTLIPWDTAQKSKHDIHSLQFEPHPYNLPEMWLYDIEQREGEAVLVPAQEIHGTVGSQENRRHNAFSDIDEIPSIWKQLWYNIRINIATILMSWAFSILPACDFKFKLSKSITNILSNDTPTNT